MTIRGPQKNIRATDVLVLSRRVDTREHFIDLAADGIKRLPRGILQGSVLNEVVQDLAGF